MDLAALTDAQIMQLPDFCFGRKWLISLGSRADVAGTFHFLSPTVLPVKTIIWGLWVVSSASAIASNGRLDIALGTVVPVNDAAFQLLDKMFPDLLGETGMPGTMVYGGIGYQIHVPLKKLIEPAGRRMVLQLNIFGAGNVTTNVGIVVSGIPTRIPEWMVSI
jgi:hypothetical protein